MKKVLIVLTVIALIMSVMLTGCGKDDIYDVIGASTPTKITTLVEYNTTQGDKLTGFYVTEIEGNDLRFTYEYERLATPEESVADNSTDRVKAISGVIEYKDGAYSGDSEEWKPGSGAAIDLKLNITKKGLKDVEISEDGLTLTGKIATGKLEDVIGSSIAATEDVSIKVETNGTNVTLISLTIKTASGTMSVRTSYSYAEIDLFPAA